jgi:cation diffusion facilitator family transporter
LVPVSGRNLTKYAWLSIGAAVLTIALKFAAYALTGSVGLLSDAAESVVNFVAAVVALVALTVAARPADETHHFGHTKAEYFSAVVEGIMIFAAAAFIIVSAVQRFLDPQPLENVGVGLAISVVASLVNGGVALVLLRAGRQHRSITLEADGKHLMTDVWTSAGVVVAVLLVALTGWLRLDPLIAIAVGVNILVAGWGLIRTSVDGLMDKALDSETQAEVDAVIARFVSDEVAVHAVRTREAGHVRYVSMHVLVPGSWSVERGHDLCHELEEALQAQLEHCEVDTHLEPREDPRAYEAHLGVAPPEPPA